MKADGPRYERETIIGYDEESDTAWLWTASDITYRHMLKRGWHPSEEGERHAQFQFPKSLLRLPRPKRKTSPEQREKKRLNLQLARQKVAANNEV